jgi:hypothetical protein
MHRSRNDGAVALISPSPSGNSNAPRWMNDRLACIRLGGWVRGPQIVAEPGIDWDSLMHIVVSMQRQHELLQIVFPLIPPSWLAHLLHGHTVQRCQDVDHGQTQDEFHKSESTSEWSRREL